MNEETADDYAYAGDDASYPALAEETSITFENRAQLLEALCLRVFGAKPVFTVPPVERPMPITDSLRDKFAGDPSCGDYCDALEKSCADLERALAEARDDLAKCQSGNRSLAASLDEAARNLPKYTYASTQQTECAACGCLKHTPLRRDEMGGYVCLTCVDKRLDSLEQVNETQG